MKLEGHSFQAYQRGRLQYWFKLVAQCRPRQEAFAAKLPPGLQQAGRSLQTLAIGQRLRELNYSDAE
eukprot:7841542-Karenia_brevis.AAC.1